VRAKGEGSVYQRKDGRWVATLYDETGRLRTLYAKTEKEALGRRRAALREGLPTGRPLTLAAWLLAWQTGLQLKPSTTKDYASKCRRITQALGKVRLDRLSAEQIELVYARWAKEGLSPGMVRNLHRVLHAALNVAVKRDLIVKNPASLVRAPAPKPKPAQALTASQAKRVLAEAAKQPDGVRWWLALLLGMRQGEVLGLEWADVDLEARVLLVRKDRAKSGKGRAIPLPEVVAAMLDQLPRSSSYVFPRASGQRRDSKADWNEWQLLLARCGLERMRVHDARHTTPTLLLELGVPARVVQEILGHSTILLTMNTYTHVHDPSLRSALEGLTAHLTAELTADSSLGQSQSGTKLAVVS